MVMQLFTKLNQINLACEQAFQVDDFDQLNVLDEQLTEAWEAIYCYQPNDSDEAKIFVLQLLNHHADCASKGEDTQNIKMKIIDVFSSQLWYHEPLKSYGT